jgi:hypothetical protein
MTRLLPMLDAFDEIRRLYFSTTRETLERDIARATELLTRMPSDADRERVAGFMHGLSDLRREWKTAPKGAAGGRVPGPKARPRAGARSAAAGRTRSGKPGRAR